MNREKVGAQPRYFENREAPGNKVGEKQRCEVWLILVWLGGGVVVWLENYKQQQQQQRLFVLYESKEIHRI